MKNFKKYDKVYCIDNHSIIGDKNSKITYNTLAYDIPYTIKLVYEYDIVLSENGCVYKKERFISEEEYFLRNRLEKIKKLKNLINVQKEEIR